MADPALQGQFPTRGLYQALVIATVCVQEQPNMRPLIADMVTALNFLSKQKYDKVFFFLLFDASSVVKDQRAIKFNGGGFVGKSTVAAATEPGMVDAVSRQKMGILIRVPSGTRNDPTQADTEMMMR